MIWANRNGVCCSVMTCRLCNLLVSPLTRDDLQEWRSNSQTATVELTVHTNTHSKLYKCLSPCRAVLSLRRARCKLGSGAPLGPFTIVFPVGGDVSLGPFATGPGVTAPVSLPKGRPWVSAYNSRRLCDIESDHEAHECSASQISGKLRCLTNQRAGASGYPTNSPELDRSITSLCEPYIRHWIMQNLPIPMNAAKAEKRVPSVRFLSEGERENDRIIHHYYCAGETMAKSWM